MVGISHVADPEIKKKGEELRSRKGGGGRNKKKITYLGSHIMSFTNI